MEGNFGSADASDWDTETHREARGDPEIFFARYQKIHLILIEYDTLPNGKCTRPFINLF